MIFGTAGCGIEEAPTPATVSGQLAGAEKTGGEKNAEGETVTKTSASQSAKDDGEIYTVRIAIVPNDSYLHSTVLNGWAQETKKKINGRLVLKVMGSSQLGGGRDHVEGMQLGNIETIQVSSTVVNGFPNDFSLLSFLYFFKDYVEIEKVFNGPIGDGLFIELEGIGIRGLTWSSDDFRNVYTKNTPVTTPVDMKGLKICVMKSDVMIATLNATNVSGIPMAYSELYSVIQQGIMDRAGNALGNTYSDGYCEICENVSLTEHFVPSGVMAISRESYDSLPDDLKEYPTESTIRFGKVEHEMDEELQEEIKRKLEEKGVQINKVDKQSFVDATAPAYTGYAGGISDTVRVLVEEESGESFN